MHQVPFKMVDMNPSSPGHYRLTRNSPTILFLSILLPPLPPTLNSVLFYCLNNHLFKKVLIIFFYLFAISNSLSFYIIHNINDRNPLFVKDNGLIYRLFSCCLLFARFSGIHPGISKMKKNV